MTKLNTDGYRRRLKAYNQDSNQGKINSVKTRILNTFHKTPSYFEVLINDELREVHITAGYKGENWIMSRPDETLEVGDAVLWAGENYLCSSIENNKLIQHKGSLSKCNNILKWQDVGGFIHETPCILMDKTSVYSDGLSKTMYMWLGTDQISITTKTTELTNSIPTNKRFIFEHDPNNIYEVTRIDNMLNKGLITFVCKKSLYNKNTDNLELNIANYNGKFEDLPLEPPIDGDGEDNNSGELVITGESRLTVWDDDVVYSVNTDKPVKWSLDSDDVLKIVDSRDNECTISPVSTVKIGSSILRVELADDSSMFAEKKIDLFYQ